LFFKAWQAAIGSFLLFTVLFTVGQ